MWGERRNRRHERRLNARKCKSIDSLYSSEDPEDIDKIEGSEDSESCSEVEMKKRILIPEIPRGACGMWKGNEW